VDRTSLVQFMLQIQAHSLTPRRIKEQDGIKKKGHDSWQGVAGVVESTRPRQRKGEDREANGNYGRGTERNKPGIMNRMTDVLFCQPIWTFCGQSVFVSLSEDSSFRAWLTRFVAESPRSLS
jgi:hypothetical protein